MARIPLTPADPEARPTGTNRPKDSRGERPTLAAGLLRLARHETGLSQRELARRAGVSASMVCAYERDRRQPTLPTLLRLLRSAGCELAMDLVRCHGLEGRLEQGTRWPKAIEERWEDYLRSSLAPRQPDGGQTDREAPC